MILVGLTVLAVLLGLFGLYRRDRNMELIGLGIGVAVAAFYLLRVIES